MSSAHWGPLAQWAAKTRAKTNTNNTKGFPMHHNASQSPVKEDEQPVAHRLWEDTDMWGANLEMDRQETQRATIS